MRDNSLWINRDNAIIISNNHESNDQNFDKPINVIGFVLLW